MSTSTSSPYNDLLKQLDDLVKKVNQGQTQTQASQKSSNTIKELLTNITSWEKALQDLKEQCSKVLSSSIDIQFDINEWEVINDEKIPAETKEVQEEQEAVVGKIKEFLTQTSPSISPEKSITEDVKQLQVTKETPKKNEKTLFETNPCGYEVLEDEKFRIIREVFNEFRTKENDRLMRYCYHSSFTRILLKLGVLGKFSSPEIQQFIYKVSPTYLPGQDIGYAEFEKHVLSLLLTKKILFSSHKRLCYLKNITAN